VPGIVDVPGVEVFGRGRGQYQLPCGYVDEQGKVHKTIVLREMTGTEEDIMDDDELPVHERTTMLLSACCEKIGNETDPEKIKAIIGDDLKAGLPITSSDRLAMRIFLRRCSCGDVYKFERTCPRCGHLNKNKQLDLRTIEMTEVPEDRVPKRRVEVVLRRSGRKAIVRVLTASHEEKLTGLSLNQKDLRSYAILARLEQLEVETEVPGADGQPPQKQKQMITLGDPKRDLDLVKALPKDDRNHLREVYNAMEADVDTSVQVSCQGRLCNCEFEFPLDLGQAFFSNTGAEPVTAEGLNWL